MILSYVAYTSRKICTENNYSQMRYLIDLLTTTPCLTLTKCILLTKILKVFILIYVSLSSKQGPVLKTTTMASTMLLMPPTLSSCVTMAVPTASSAQRGPRTTTTATSSRTTSTALVNSVDSTPTEQSYFIPELVKCCDQ